MAAALTALAGDPGNLAALRKRFTAQAPAYGWDRFFALLLPFLERLENE